MDPVRELPYWPAAMALLIEAGQMTASDYVPTYPNYCLHPKGRPQMPVRTPPQTGKHLDDLKPDTGSAAKSVKPS